VASVRKHAPAMQ